MNLKDLLTDLTLGFVGIICLILSVFSSHWFFLPIVILLTLWAIGGKIPSYRRPVEDRWIIIKHDGRYIRVPNPKSRRGTGGLGPR